VEAGRSEASSLQGRPCVNSVEMLFDANASARQVKVGTEPVTREVIDRTVDRLDGYDRARRALIVQSQLRQVGFVD